MENNYDLEKLYEWIMDENRKPATTAFTSSIARNIAKEIEFRLSNHAPTSALPDKQESETEKPFKYFVSYFFKDDSGKTGFGNIHILRNKPISSYQDVDSIAELLKRENKKDAAILNYILLSGEIPTPSTKQTGQREAIEDEIPEPIKLKIEEEANWRSTNGHGGVDEITRDNFILAAEYGYLLKK